MFVKNKVKHFKLFLENYKIGYVDFTVLLLYNLQLDSTKTPIWLLHKYDFKFNS